MPWAFPGARGVEVEAPRAKQSGRQRKARRVVARRRVARRRDGAGREASGCCPCCGELLGVLSGSCCGFVPRLQRAGPCGCQDGLGSDGCPRCTLCAVTAPPAPGSGDRSPAGLQIPRRSSGCSCSRQGVRLAEIRAENKIFCRRWESLVAGGGRGSRLLRWRHLGDGDSGRGHAGGRLLPATSSQLCSEVSLTVSTASGTARWAGAGAAWWQQGRGQGQARPLG